MKKRGMNEHTIVTMISFQYCDRSSLDTPTKVSLIIEPVQPRIAILKFAIPVSKAKLVASICWGVIFAKMTQMGRRRKH